MKQHDQSRGLPFFGIGKILPFLKKYKKFYVFMISLGLMGSIFDIIIPVFQKYALDHFIGLSTYDNMLWFILIYVSSILLASLVNFISTKYASQVEVFVNRDLRNAAFDHLQTLSFSYFNRNSVGYIHSRVISDTSRIGDLVSWVLMDSIWHFSYIFGSIFVMMTINIRLTLMIMAIVPLVVFLFTFFERKLVAVNREIRECNAQITGDFNEGITGAKTIKTMVIEDKIADSFRRDTADMKKKSVKASHLNGIFAGTMDFASSLALAVVLWKGGYIADSQVGTFSLFMSYAMGLMEPIRWLIEAVTSLITTKVNIERFSNLLETESDVVDTPEVVARYGDTFSPKKENWEPIRGDITFSDVTFQYPDGDDCVLEHFNLDIPFGSNVAIVGETGAGKTTLVNLVCRFFEPTKGTVLIDGVDARKRSQLWLHTAIGYVLQTPHLFSGTVRENLLYGNPDATDEEIRRALELVSAQDIVDRLEKGLDSDVGEGGDLLSAGEKQLLSFARAILANPKILILDEATASVDTITEQKIQAAIDTVIRGRTSIVIAHRLSTIRNADVILVVQDGKIIEQGRHASLMQARGHYYNLYTRQYEDEATSSALR